MDLEKDLRLQQRLNEAIFDNSQQLIVNYGKSEFDPRRCKSPDLLLIVVSTYQEH